MLDRPLLDAVGGLSTLGLGWPLLVRSAGKAKCGARMTTQVVVLFVREESWSKSGKAKKDEGKNKAKHNLAISRSDLSIGSLTA